MWEVRSSVVVAVTIPHPEKGGGEDRRMHSGKLGRIWGKLVCGAVYSLSPVLLEHTAQEIRAKKRVLLCLTFLWNSDSLFFANVPCTKGKNIAHWMLPHETSAFLFFCVWENPFSIASNLAFPGSCLPATSFASAAQGSPGGSASGRRSRGRGGPDRYSHSNSNYVM